MTAGRVPTEARNAASPAGRYVATVGIDAYRAQYRAGWAAADRGTNSRKFDSGYHSDAWEDGYLDRAAGRERWHMLRCADHDACGSG